jgi:hypothetical protein
MAVAPESPETATGVGLWSPQQLTVPSPSNAQVCEPPAASAGIDALGEALGDAIGSVGEPAHAPGEPVPLPGGADGLAEPPCGRIVKAATVPKMRTAMIAAAPSPAASGRRLMPTWADARAVRIEAAIEEAFRRAAAPIPAVLGVACCGDISGCSCGSAAASAGLAVAGSFVTSAVCSCGSAVASAGLAVAGSFVTPGVRAAPQLGQTSWSAGSSGLAQAGHHVRDAISPSYNPFGRLP